MRSYKAKIHVWSKIHRKMFKTWNTLHAFLCLVILSIVQLQIHIYVAVTLFLKKRISIHAFMNVYTEDKQWSPEHVQIIEVSSLVNNRIRLHPA